MCDLSLTQKTFKEWMCDNFDHNELKDIVRFGVQNGFHGLIYYRETSALYAKYHEEMWNYLYEDADSQGISCLEVIASLNGACHVDDHVTFVNLITWYSAERVAYGLIESEE